MSVGDTLSSGDAIAEVGNAGFSTEPHLHFAAFEIDSTGRARGLPMVVSGLQATDSTPLDGVPRGAEEYVSQ